MNKLIMILLSMALSMFTSQAENRTFVHPGTLHTQASLDYARGKLTKKENPWYNAYLSFSNIPQSKKTYVMYGGDEIATRDAGYNTASRNHKAALESDSYAIYCQALMYKLTNNADYAKKAVAILNDWSLKLEKVVGADLELTVGFNAYFMAIGADLLYGYAGWESGEVERAKRMFREVWYPHIKGIEREYGQGTWDSASAKCVMAISVFLEDWDMFDSAYEYFFTGKGNGTVNHYFIESGQSQESGRRQGYAQLGLSNFAEWCEIAYNQGYEELWNARDYIIAASFEYHAKYNLGEEVPFRVITGQYPGTTFPSISEDGRGDFKPTYFIAYNHFHNRKGLDMPYTLRVITEKQPEEKMHATITDGAGWGTLFFNNPDQGSDSSVLELQNDTAHYVWAAGNSLHIRASEGKQLRVYDLSGCLLLSRNVSSDEERIEMRRGTYIVKVAAYNPAIIII